MTRDWQSKAIPLVGLAVALIAVLAAGHASAGGSVDFDVMFRQARELAFGGQRDEARRVARDILQQAPQYVDVEVFLARLDAWDGRFEEAATTLEDIVAAHPEHVDARLALVDVRLWQGNLEAARAGCKRVLLLDPPNTQARERLDRIQRLLATTRPELPAGTRPHENIPPSLEPPSPNAGANAASMVKETRSATESPGTFPPATQRAVLPGARRGYRAGLEYRIEDFNQDFGAWHQAIASIEKRSSWGSVIGRLNYFNRFNDTAAQFDIEVYPELGEGTYANIAATAATDGILPDYSLLLELYRALPKGLEGSLGVRYIRFTSPARVYTGSLGLYRGNYWMALRPLVTETEEGTTVSWSAKIRRYFADEEDYITLTLTRGRELEGTSASLTLFELDTDTAIIELRKRIAPRYVVKVLGGYEVQALPRRSDRRKITFGLGFEYLF